MKIYALIQARGNSKTIPKKNIKLLGGYPLIAYSIIAAKMINEINRVIVSTDSKEIAAVASHFGAEVPFMRPAEYSTDLSGDLEIFQHALEWLKTNGEAPDLFVQLRPTAPLREPNVIMAGIEELISDSKATGLRSVHHVNMPPEKIYRIDKKGYLEGCFPDNPSLEYYNQPRQCFRPAYWGNGHIDIVRPETIEKGSMYGSNIIGFPVSFLGDIDDMDDWGYAEYMLRKKHFAVYDYLKDYYRRMD